MRIIAVLTDEPVTRCWKCKFNSKHKCALLQRPCVTTFAGRLDECPVISGNKKIILKDNKLDIEGI